MRHLLTTVFAAVVASVVATDDAHACCAAGPSGQPVVNADQSVILVWDSATKTEHFIRRASFRSEADDFGFLVPTPSQPELAESGNDAFPLLQKLTEPEHKKMQRPSNGEGGCCSPAAYSYGAKPVIAPVTAPVLAGVLAPRATRVAPILGRLWDGFGATLRRLWADSRRPDAERLHGHFGAGDLWLLYGRLA